jgi:hypothetical protein
MTRRKTEVIHVLLDLDSLDEASRDALIAGVLEMAPQSPLYLNDPRLQEQVAGLAKSQVAYKAAMQTAAASAAQHVSDVTATFRAQTVVNKSLRFLRMLVQTYATSVGDVQSMAFVPYDGPPPPPPLEPPDSIDVRPGPKLSGRATVSAHYTGKTRRCFEVDVSPNPATDTSWQRAPGSGKSRKLTGESGTSVWVRFALVRGQRQSAWGTPVLITFP